MTVVFRIARLSYVTSVAVELASTLDVWLFATIPYVLIGCGMSVSTTRASISAVIEVGMAGHGIRGANKRMVLAILSSWLLMPTITTLLGYELYLALASSTLVNAIKALTQDPRKAIDYADSMEKVEEDADEIRMKDEGS